MTCIVGMVDGSGEFVVIGGDSAGVSGWTLTLRSDRKAFVLQPGIVIGYTSSFRMGQLLQFSLPHFELPEPGDEFRWAVTVFIPAVRKAFADGGYLRKDNERESGGAFLLDVRGALFEIDSDFQVGVPSSGLASCGCGFAEAMGALEALVGSPSDKSTTATLRRALAISERLNAGVRGPFEFVSTELGVTDQQPRDTTTYPSEPS